jgi:glycosyltransferase involved in cell wall biosynthesis
MYFVPIIVPVFVQGEQQFVHSDWKRGLGLLRDSLGGKYGELVIAAPWLPLDDPTAGEQTLEAVDAHDGITFQPMFDWRARARDFWLLESRRIRRELDESVAKASVVHAGMDDLHRPMMTFAVLAAVRRGVPVILVQDTDIVTQIKQQPGDTAAKRAKSAAYVKVYERVGRKLVASAELSLLKGKELMLRYGPYARNPREFHNTSYMAAEVVREDDVAARLASLSEARPLRFVYCGRLVGRKGVDDSVRMIEHARRMGANVSLDLIGRGPAEALLQTQIEDAGLRDVVRLLGGRPYGPALLRELSSYDAVLFAPLSEDTPRMIFDGYAAGLPLVGVGIPYVRERAVEEAATIVLPRGDVIAAAECLLAIDRDRQQLVPLTMAALRAARHHAADSWYQRRAEWTHAAVAGSAAGRRGSTQR